MPDPGPDGPPPNYVSSQPQILVAPRPDAASFFWGRTVQGEVFVKGLGQARGLQHLSVRLHLCDTLPDHPSVPLHVFPSVTLYPPAESSSSSINDGNGTTSSPPVHRFSIHLPPDSHMPGTLDLASSNRGQIKWYLTVRLALHSGQVIEELVLVEGTPPEVGPSEGAIEVEEVLQRDGVRARLLLDTHEPRLGSLLRLGLEVRAMEREKTRVAGLSAQPNPAQTLRPLRRVRVELFRRVRILTPSVAASSSSTSPAPEDGRQHLTLLYASGKSLRYPGMNPVHPPLRVLFTIPTTQLGSAAEQSWGEITMSTVYHDVLFFVRVSIGFDGPDPDWVLEKTIRVRPKIWKEPRQIVDLREQQLVLGGDATGMMTDEEAYRLKGRDTVGANGTIRVGSHTLGEDLPPPFEGEGSAGPSRGGLPTFLESEAQMRAGEVPVPVETVASQHVEPGPNESDGLGEMNRSTIVGRRGSLGGELGTWVEYDGYETFSVQPPPVGVSFGVGGSMDPPQEGDDDNGVAPGAIRGINGLALMEELGLGEGTRVIDLQDDLPPGIDEPSLPALPDFSNRQTRFRSSSHPQVAPVIDHGHEPPSFDASEAAQAVGGVAISRNSVVGELAAGMGVGEAPPGYFGGTSPAGSGQGGPPAYS